MYSLLEQVKQPADADNKIRSDVKNDEDTSVPQQENRPANAVSEWMVS